MQSDMKNIYETKIKELKDMLIMKEKSSEEAIGNLQTENQLILEKSLGFKSVLRYV